MRNYFPKLPPGASLHTWSKIYDVSVGFVPLPSFEAVYCFICACRRLAIARYRMICRKQFSGTVHLQYPAVLFRFCFGTVAYQTK